MLTYRVTTDGRKFRVEMFDPANLYKEWLPIAGPFDRREQAEAECDRELAKQADEAAHPWVPV